MNAPTRRPIYENDETLKIEREIAEEVCSYIKDAGALHKLPMSYSVDFLLTSQSTGQFKLWLEAKDKPHYTAEQLDRMGGYMIGQLKMDKARIWASRPGRQLPLLLAVQCVGSLHVLRWQPGDPWDYEQCWGGRNDRGDPQDMEPCYLIPMAQSMTRLR